MYECGEAMGPCIELMFAHCSLVLVNPSYSEYDVIVGLSKTE